MRIVLTLCLLGFLVSPVFGDIGALFPQSVSFAKNEKQYQLQLTGASARKKFFIKIYNVASYLQADHDGDLKSAIMDDKNAKQLTVKWTFNADLKRVRSGYMSSFKEALSEKEYQELMEDITKYLSFLRSDIKKGDEHVLRWLPGGYVEVMINGNFAGSITNLFFARALWGIWFGGDSVANGGSLLSLGNKS